MTSSSTSSDAAALAGASPGLERFSYDDVIVRKFLFATLLWAVVGMAVGILIALQLVHPIFNLGLEWTSFGRLRPLHTNAVIFAFAGNGIFTAIYYSTQRLLKARMFSDLLSKVHFWGWQLIIVLAAVTLPLGKVLSLLRLHHRAAVHPTAVAVALLLGELLSRVRLHPRAAADPE